MKKKLFLVDAYAMIFRSYYAFIRNPRIDSNGRNTSAIFGFALILEDIIEKERPDYIGVVFDPPGGSFRREMYSEYKANREETPEDIKKSVPHIKRLISSYQIPIFECPGYEADDVIATMARKAEKEGIDVYMVTSDKDFGQIVSPSIFIYSPMQKGGGYNILGEKEVCEKFGISHPKQVIDILGLMGDSADNIPGVKGLGPKSASKLLAQYTSVEGVVEHISDIKGKLGENISDHLDDLLLSKKLATIDVNAPVELHLEELQAKPANEESLCQFFEEFEIRTLLSRILKNNSERYLSEISEFVDRDPSRCENEILKEFEVVKNSVKYIENKEDISRLCASCLECKEMIFALLPYYSDIFTTPILELCIKTGDSIYHVNIPCEQEEGRVVLDLLRDAFEHPDVVKKSYDLKKSMHLLSHYGISIVGSNNEDVMIQHYVIEPELSHTLNSIVENNYHYKIIAFEDLVGVKKSLSFDMRLTPIDDRRRYLIEEVFFVDVLSKYFDKKIRIDKLDKVYRNVEMPLVEILFEMERTGALIDVNELHKQEQSLNLDLEKIAEKIYLLSGEHFNINSATQVGQILFDKLAIIDKPKKTKTGKYKTSEEELEKLTTLHPIVSLILSYRGLKKLISTYVSTLPDYLRADHRLHTTFNQAIVATGRLSSSNPNIQNIPIRTAEGRKIRSAFVPSKGNIFVSADYSQIELRLMAHLSNDKALIDAFLSGQDIHKATASQIYNVPIEFVDDDMRRKAKTANFGIIYGISTFGLSQRLNVSRAEANALIEGYFESYPEVKSYMNRQIEMAKKNGYVTTLLGRRRYIKDINSSNAVVRGYAERNAINAPLQGSAADIIKLAMVSVYLEMKKQGLRSQMILQVHDELIFDVIPNELDRMTKIIKEKMEHAIDNLKVPLVVEVGCGKSWLEAH